MADSPFDPPKPPQISAAETSGAIAGVVVIGAVDIATGGLFSAIAAIPGSADSGPPDIQAGLDSIRDTGAPPRDADGNVACSRCGTFVSWASMSLNEHGYFCAACAAPER